VPAGITSVVGAACLIRSAPFIGFNSITPVGRDIVTCKGRRRRPSHSIFALSYEN